MRISSGVLSVGLHCLGVAALLLVGGGPASEPELRLDLRRNAVIIAPLRWRHAGGGQREPLPASKGRLPPIARQRIFTPPTAHILNDNPKLAVAQAVLIDPDLTPPNVEMDRIGSPFGVDAPLSGGPGGPGGIGAGTCCGVGDGIGPSIGGQAGASASARASRRRPSRGPQVVEMIEPEYSDDARRARISGVVIVALEVGIDGRAHNMRVVRPLGLGLDERALDAVARWRFRPALADGRPIAWPATIEVNFRLL